MNLEEQLDFLIETGERSEIQPPRASDEVIVRLAAADILTQLQDVPVPLELTERVEAQVRARIFRQASQNGKVFALPRTPVVHVARSFDRRRMWMALLSAAALVLLLSIGTLTAAARSLPGDSLYGLKQVEFRSALVFASSPQARAEADIGQLRGTLADLNSVIIDGRDQVAIQQALSTVVTKTNDSRAAVTALPDGPDHAGAQRDLDSALAAEEHALRALIRQVNWPVRLAFTQQLGALGEAIPSVTRVSVSQQSDGTLLLTVLGTNFAPSAELVINGQPQGPLPQSTTTQLTGVVSQTDWHHDTQAIGVLNPDGTAAQTQVVLHGDDNTPSGGDDHGRHGTPGPGNTPTSGDDHGGHSGSGKSSGTLDDH